MCVAAAAKSLESNKSAFLTKYFISLIFINFDKLYPTLTYMQLIQILKYLLCINIFILLWVSHNLLRK